jgi:hypothetical protein
VWSWSKFTSSPLSCLKIRLTINNGGRSANELHPLKILLLISNLVLYSFFSFTSFSFLVCLSWKHQLGYLGWILHVFTHFSCIPSLLLFRFGCEKTELWVYLLYFIYLFFICLSSFLYVCNWTYPSRHSFYSSFFFFLIGNIVEL